MDFLTETLNSLMGNSSKKSTKEQKEKPVEPEQQPLNNNENEVTIVSPPLVDYSETITAIQSPLVEEKGTRMNVSIPAPLKARFKARCSQSGQNMSTLIQLWIKRYLSLDETEAAHNEN